MFFFITASGPIISFVGYSLGFPILFWIGVLIAAFNLFMNVASGVMNFPILPLIIMIIAAILLPPWYFGAASGLLAWTVLELLGHVYARIRPK